jgi:hypothetical protein
MMMQIGTVLGMLDINSIFTGFISQTSMYKNAIFLHSTKDLTEHTKEHYKIYSVLQPVYMAVK